MNNDNSLYKSVKYSKLLPSLLPLLSSKTLNPIMEYCWEKCLTRLGLKDENLQTLPSNFQTTDKYAFGILDGNVWKIKLEENISKINFSSQNSDVQVIEDSNDYFDEHLNINLFKSYMDEIRELFQKLSNSKSEYKRKLKQNDQNLVERIIITDKLLQVWKIKIIGHNKIMLRVFKKADVKRKWELTDTKITKFNVSDARKIKLLEIKLFTDDDIILITTIGFLIYHFNENKKSMSLIYWNYLELTYPNVGTLNFEDPEFFGDFKALLKPYYTLQFNLPLLNYDSFKICDEWISYVKDNKGNLLKYGDKLLSFAIKEHKLDLIEEIYKKCISWFNEDLGNNWMFLSIITSTTPLLNKYYPEYILRYSLETTMIIDHPFYSIEYQHTKSLYSFQYLQLVDLTRSILWSKYKFFLHGLLNNYETIFWILIILRLLILIVMILLLPFFLIYIAVFYILEKYHFINEIFDIGVFSTFYFVLSNKLTTRETPIITFMVPYIKFVNYPLYYNWFLELIKPQPSLFVETISRDIYKTWSGEAIINFKWNTYGRFIHLSFEVRQFIYNPLKWFYDFWNIFDIIAYLLPIYTSIYWLQINNLDNRSVNINDPNINDPNNPWKLAPTYNQIFENGTIDSNPFLIQPPNENTNMFIDFKTSLFTMYKFLTGDPSALSNWTYLNNPPLVILIVLFSFLIVVYLMNLFIGLLNNAINKDYNRVSYLVQKAEILAEIELFYLLPHQRRWKEWFPEVIHYSAKINDVRKEVEKMMNQDEWNTNAFPELKDDLLKKLNIQQIPDK
ncbi:hypothetical protein GLOIN_2v1874127 [Rhizophagus irregularis DAOM 181602=DAOM 197198]|nr:hypothetical protein GLOIN_2v1874127 [Rhizophagus irregularis DAOM 181602=DAOM 197198]